MKHETDTTLLVLPHQGTKDPQRDQAGVPVHQREGVTKKESYLSKLLGSIFTFYPLKLIFDYN